MAPTIDEVLAASQEVLVPYWDKKIIDLIREAHPFGDWLVTKGIARPVKEWKRKLALRHPNSAMMREVAKDIAPGALSSTAFGEVTRTMRAITARIGWIEDDFLIKEGDPAGTSVIEKINRRVQHHLEGVLKLLIFGMMADHSGGNGVLFEIPKPADMGGNDTFAIDAEVPVIPKYYPLIWPGLIVSIHEKGNSTAITGLEQVMIKTKRRDSSAVAGWEYAITLDTALTGATAVPAAGCEIVAQGSYGLGLESLPALLSQDGTVDFMGEKSDDVPQWRSFALDAGGTAIDLVEHLGPVLEELEEAGVEDWWMLLPPRQRFKLEAYIRSHQNVQTEPYKMEGGWDVMQLKIRSKPLKFLTDKWLINSDEIYIIDRADLEFQYWGGGQGKTKAAPIYLKKRGGGTAEGQAFITALTESSVNTYVTDILCYPSGLLCSDRRRHAIITSLEV